MVLVFYVERIRTLLKIIQGNLTFNFKILNSYDLLIRSLLN